MRWCKAEHDTELTAAPRHTNPRKKMNLQVLLSRWFANFGLQRRNAKCQKENRDMFVKGTSNTIRPDEEDHISTLPDDVLSSILSLLSMRDAVKTSILSRRWRYLCATLPDINFDMDETFFDGMHHCGKIVICPKKNPMFVIGVSRFLNQYLGPKLRSFRVSFCCDAESTSVVDHWISLAVRMGVKKLDLQFVCNDILYRDFDDYCVYYHNMYGDNTIVEFFWWQLFRACDFLKHLCLNSCAIMLPPGSRYKVFYGLSTIDLIHVPLIRNELQYIFRSCLNLESLKVRHCRLPATLCISGVARLEILVIDTCFGLEEIELNELVNLATFEFCHPDIQTLSFSCVPKLEHVFFTHRFPQNFLEAVGNLPELKTLRIAKYTYWASKTIDSPYVLRTLKHLELFIIDGDGYDMVEIIAPLLRACPLVQRLNVVLPLPKITIYQIESKEPPRHLHDRLEEVHIGGFSGTLNNFDFAVCLLRSIVSLKRMVIDRHYRIYKGDGLWVSGESNIWSAEVRERICNRLQGSNLSENAEVIIR